MAARSVNLLRYITRQAAASTPDAVLLQRFITDRDEDAFAGLVRRHGPIVYRVCRRMLGPTAAEDAFQATFLVLATRAATVRKAGSVGSWLIGVAGRVARQMHKSERRRAIRERSLPISSRGSEVDQAEAAEQSRILDEELTRLSDRLRGPVVACLLQGRTYEQAATELGGSARTVRRRLEEAKRFLRIRLERRGVLPAAAAGLIVGIGSAEAAVPAGLGARTLAAMSGFLAGGATIPAALLAKGVVATMTTSVRVMAVLLATTAAGLTALGFGLAGDGEREPKVAPPTPASSPAISRDREVMIPDERYSPPSAGVVRAIEHEARHLRGEIGHRWFGPNWRPNGQWKLEVIGGTAGLVPGAPPNVIRITYFPGALTHSETELNFALGRVSHMTDAAVDVSGELKDVIDQLLPREMTHVVMAETLGQSLSWWAGQGMAADAEHLQYRFLGDRQCRSDLEAGRCVRLPALFDLKDDPEYGSKVPAQAHAVVRFLLSRKGKFVGIELAGTGREKLSPPASAEGTLLSFVSCGMSRGWDHAAKTVYGYEDVAALETAWLEWMKSKASQIECPVQDITTRRPTHPPLIPPVKLP